MFRQVLVLSFQGTSNTSLVLMASIWYLSLVSTTSIRKKTQMASAPTIAPTRMDLMKPEKVHSGGTPHWALWLAWRQSKCIKTSLLASTWYARLLTLSSRTWMTQWSNLARKTQKRSMRVFTILDRHSRGAGSCYFWIDQIILNNLSVPVDMLNDVVDLTAHGLVYFCVGLQNLVRAVKRREPRRSGPYEGWGCAELRWIFYSKDHKAWKWVQDPSLRESVYNVPWWLHDKHQY